MTDIIKSSHIKKGYMIPKRNPMYRWENAQSIDGKIVFWKLIFPRKAEEIICVFRFSFLVFMIRFSC